MTIKWGVGGEGGKGLNSARQRDLKCLLKCRLSPPSGQRGQLQGNMLTDQERAGLFLQETQGSRARKEEPGFTLQGKLAAPPQQVVMRIE